MNLADQTAVAEAMLGRDVEEFLRSDIGRYLVARAESEEREALEELAKVWPWRRRRISQMQAQVWRARSFQTWLGEMIVTGKQAMAQMENRE